MKTTFLTIGLAMILVSLYFVVDGYHNESAAIVSTGLTIGGGLCLVASAIACRTAGVAEPARETARSAAVR
jgi:hypothetical protein